MSTSTTEFLTAAELHALTGWKQAGKQDEWLRGEGLPHRLTSGRVIVSRVHVRAWLEGRPVVASNAPNLAALRA